MVDKIKRGAHRTATFVTVGFTIVALLSGIASALGVATKPLVKSGLGTLPIWQFVAAVQFAVLIGFVGRLIYKEIDHD